MDSTQVWSHLGRILDSPGFRRSESLRALLRFVVEETIAGRAHQIKESVLGAEVLGRGCDFDPKADPIVRVQASRLREKLAAFYASEGARDSIVIDLPKGAYVPVIRHQRRCKPRTLPA